MPGRQNMSSRAMSRRSSPRSSNPSNRGANFRRRNKTRPHPSRRRFAPLQDEVRLSHPELHLTRIAAFQIAVPRHRPEREKLRISVIAKIEDARESGRREPRLVPEAVFALHFDEILHAALDGGMIAFA